MDDEIKSQIRKHLADYQKHRQELGLMDQDRPFISYGTAGFRGDSIKIDHLFFKVGLIASLICLKEHGNIGIMITASHNPIADNGVKIIDSKGEMLSSEWEKLVENFCNIHDDGRIIEQLEQIITNNKLNLKAGNSTPKVLIGCDTRPSSQRLVGLVQQGIDSLKPFSDYLDYGLITTPALHYIVAESNIRSSDLPAITIDDYYNQLASGMIDILSQKHEENQFYSKEALVIDCANGVGSLTVGNLTSRQDFSSRFNIIPINTDIKGPNLNSYAGADYVKTTHKPPKNANDTTKRYAALDGDADRLIYFYLTNDDRSNDLMLHLVDGDKIMALLALYMRDVLRRNGLDKDLTLGIVQTAYANGASTSYMRNELNLQVDFTDTGVKNLHKKALQYDFGIYFEANGHGTMWISSKARDMVRCKGISELIRLFSVINNYTGDAVSDVLLVETILHQLDWDIRRWDKLYQDKPNSLIKVEVKDRSVIKTTNAGQTCTQPVGLQEKIDEIVKSFGPGARSFVRASGTENVVRIYAEADTQSAADKLAQLVGDETRKACDSL